MGDGLAKEDQLLGAARYYLRIFEKSEDFAKNLKISPHHSVELRHWLWVRFRDLRRRMSVDDRLAFDALVKKLYQPLSGQPLPEEESLVQFSKVFGRHPLGEAALERLVQLHDSEGSPIELERMLLRLASSPDLARRKRAVARLARLMSKSKTVLCGSGLPQNFAFANGRRISALKNKTGDDLYAEGFGRRVNSRDTF